MLGSLLRTFDRVVDKPPNVRREGAAARAWTQRAPSPNSTTRTVSSRIVRSRKSEWFLT